MALPNFYRKLIFTIFVVTTCTSSFFSYSTEYPKTIFMPRSLTENAMLEFGLNYYHTYHSMLDYDELFSAALYFTPFYFHTTNHSTLTNYFSPNGTSTISIRENGTGDIGSAWLGLTGTTQTPFAADISITPKRLVGGMHSMLYMNLDSFCTNTWASVSFACARIRQSLNITESDRSIDGGQELKTVHDAFNNPAWNFGKLKNDAMHKFGIDDIQCKFGYNKHWDDENHVGFYALVTIPTGKKENLTYLFEPIIGSRHASFGFGAVTDFGGWITDHHFLNWMTILQYNYLFSAKEMRTFDLKNHGAWSRYLQVVDASSTSAPQPGINFFTKEVTVCPNSRLQLWSALHYECYNWGIELGYNYWWRNHETIKNLSCQNNIAIFDIAASPIDTAISASTAQISQGTIAPNIVKSDTIFTPIAINDFDLESAAHPKASTHTFYGAVCYTGELDECPATIGFGSSYEYARHCAAYTQWGVWMKMSVGF